MAQAQTQLQILGSEDALHNITSRAPGRSSSPSLVVYTEKVCLPLHLGG